MSYAGVRNPYFTDEDFIGTDFNRAQEIARRIRLAKESRSIDPQLEFYINLPVSALAISGSHAPGSATLVLQSLKQAGLREVFLGLESGCEGQLRRYNKRASQKANADSLNLLRSLGIEIDIGFIMFDPQMTLDDLSDNLKFIWQAGLIEHDARDTKAVRVEAGTKLSQMLVANGLANPVFDVDSLCHPYHFLDRSVQFVFERFQEWEKETLPIIWSIQGSSRGEIPHKLRLKLKRLLGALRRLDYEVLCALVKIASNNQEVSVDIPLTIEDHREQRRSIIQSWQDAYPEQYRQYRDFTTHFRN